MTYEEAKKLEAIEKGKSRKEIGTTYLFLLISVIFYLLFFLNARELPVIGCAFLCDGAALVYGLRAIKKLPPFRQAILAAQCAEHPAQEAVYRLCASVETAGNRVRYNSGARERFSEALAACAKAEDLPERDRERLEKALRPFLK